MRSYFEQLKSHPKIARGWIVRGVLPSLHLRFVTRNGNKILQQSCSVTWEFSREIFIDGQFTNRDMTIEWLDVPTEEETSIGKKAI